MNAPSVSAMLGLRLLGVGLLTALVLNCGGSSTGDSPGATNGGASVSGASSDGMQCAGAPPDGGCGGAGGDAALEPDARLHTACNLDIRVNRRGQPVCIDFRF